MGEESVNTDVPHLCNLSSINIHFVINFVIINCVRLCTALSLLLLPVIILSFVKESGE